MNNRNEILLKQMYEASEIWNKIYQNALSVCIPKRRYIDVDKIIGEFMKKYNVLSAPQSVYNYPSFACVSVNSCVCHGVATQDKINVGDIVSIDISFKYKDNFIDAARTIVITGTESLSEKQQEKINKLQELINFNKHILDLSIKEASEMLLSGKTITNKTFGRIFHREIHNTQKYSINAEYGGHGISTVLHDSPFIHNYVTSVDNSREEEILPNTYICVEPIVALRGKNIIFKTTKIGFDIFNSEGLASSHFENTYYVTKDNILQIT